LTERVLVRVGGNRRHLRDEPDDGLVDVPLALGLLVERRQRADRRRTDRHRMRILREAPKNRPKFSCTIV
jgi:hypothetical protein